MQLREGMKDRFRCEECAAEFATESEMFRHVSEPHVRAKSGERLRMATPPHGEKLPIRDKKAPREGREFTRSPRE